MVAPLVAAINESHAYNAPKQIKEKMKKHQHIPIKKEKDEMFDDKVMPQQATDQSDL
jgi:hypothetical protein